MSKEGCCRFWLFGCHSAGVEHFVVSKVPGLPSFTTPPQGPRFPRHVSPSKHVPLLALFKRYMFLKNLKLISVLKKNTSTVKYSANTLNI